MQNIRILLWQGRSLLDKAPIFVMLTGLGAPSANPKTGIVIQSYILTQKVDPPTARQTGQDRTGCQYLWELPPS